MKREKRQGHVLVFFVMMTKCKRETLFNDWNNFRRM